MGYMIALSYIAAALASLAAMTMAVSLLVFAMDYYGSDYLNSLMLGLTGAGLVLLFAAIVVSVLALIRLLKSLPQMATHRRICGLCGLLIGLIAVPVLAIDRDAWLAGAIALAGLIIALPSLIARPKA